VQSRLREIAPTVHIQLHAETEALPEGEAGAEVLNGLRLDGRGLVLVGSQRLCSARNSPIADG
jgi:hypothetical protein